MTGMRRRREPAARDADAPAPARGQDRDDRGETLALLVLWPALLVAIWCFWCMRSTQQRDRLGPELHYSFSLGAVQVDHFV